MDEAGTDNYNTKLVLLGTGGGVSYWPGCDRASSSSALVVGDNIYLIDLGQGATNRINQAFNPKSVVDSDDKYLMGKNPFLQNVKGLFFTHLHPDHIADYANFLLVGAGTGLGTIPGKIGQSPLPVYGPCDRGCLEANVAHFAEAPIQNTISPEAPTSTPGTKQMTETILQAFAQAMNDMMLDDAYPDYQKLVEVHEIGNLGDRTNHGEIKYPLPETLPSAGNPEGTAPNNPPPRDITCVAMNPRLLFDDGTVRVWHTLVNHAQVYPSFAFRFDTPDGSVVFSGDTGADTNGNLQRLCGGSPFLTSDEQPGSFPAKCADILVHEVIDEDWIKTLAQEQRQEDSNSGKHNSGLITHMLRSHTPISEVG
ncbi:hypothetical protein BVY04_02180 [bacterium M21]|nr:hypothetical protein BVY04_02180 [bacterium M21]